MNIRPSGKDLMNLCTLAKLSFIGLGYIYAAKLVDTIYHGVFHSSAVVMTVVTLNILAGLVQLLFFVALYQQFVPKGQKTLRIAGWLGIIGSAIGMLPKLLAFNFLLQPQTPSALIVYGVQIKAFAPLLTALLLFLFSIIIFLKHDFGQDRFLRTAFAAGSAGWFIMATAQSLVAINFMNEGRFVWLADLFSVGSILFVTASSLTFICLSIFYLAFTRR
jgi:hypothetical protein